MDESVRISGRMESLPRVLPSPGDAAPRGEMFSSELPGAPALRQVEYPSSDGAPMAETEFQYDPMTYTVSVLKIRYEDSPNVYVGGSLLVYYERGNNIASIAPNAFVVFGVKDGNRFRETWKIWEEGAAPSFVMEVAAKSAWEWDASGKRDIYAGMGVQEYWRFDPTGEFFTPRLVGKRLEDGEYLPIAVWRQTGTGYSEGIVQSWDWTSAYGRTRRSGFMTRFAKDGSAAIVNQRGGLANSKQRCDGFERSCNMGKGERNGQFWESVPGVRESALPECRQGRTVSVGFNNYGIRHKRNAIRMPAQAFPTFAILSVRN